MPGFCKRKSHKKLELVHKMWWGGAPSVHVFSKSDCFFWNRFLLGSHTPPSELPLIFGVETVGGFRSLACLHACNRSLDCKLEGICGLKTDTFTETSTVRPEDLPSEKRSSLPSNHHFVEMLC